MSMTAKDAWLYAASWGSFNTYGDPGACLYGFDERFRVQHEAHRAECLARMEGSRAYVEAHPADYDADELDQMALFVARLKSARLESDPDPLDALDEFTQGYVDALFFTDNAVNAEDGRTFELQAESEEDENEGQFPASASGEDIAADTLALIIADCAEFQTVNAALLAQAYARDYSAARAGHDFWLTRNHRGAGYWDRSELESDDSEYERLTAEMVANRDNADAWGAALAKRNVIKDSSLGQLLTKAAHAYGEAESYFGDDGRIHL